jgi:molybdopterin biosynthesis enzyme
LLTITTVIVTYLGERSYAMLSGLASAAALVVRTANAPSAAIGEHVAVIRFDLAPGF